jgi:hypothetical protein
MFGQQRLDVLRPLDETQAVAEEIVLVAQFKEFLDTLNAVGVEVVDGESVAGVLVDECEGRAGDRLARYPECFSNTLDEMRLARAEVTVERHNVAGREYCGEASAHRHCFFCRGCCCREYRVERGVRRRHALVLRCRKSKQM